MLSIGNIVRNSIYSYHCHMFKPLQRLPMQLHYVGIFDGFWRSHSPKWQIGFCGSFWESQASSLYALLHCQFKKGGKKRGKQKTPHTWWFVLGYYSDESRMKTHTVLLRTQTCRHLSEKKTEKENKLSNIILSSCIEKKIYLDEISIWIFIYISYSFRYWCWIVYSDWF